MKQILERQDAAVVQQITHDGLFRVDALAERGGYDQTSLRVTFIAGAAYEMLKGGMCRGELFKRLELVLAGRCNCEVETKGSA